jgi:DNA-binding CsgD family transcriptional regulator
VPTRQRLDDAALLDLVGEVMGVLDIDELGHAMLETLRRAVPSKWASLNEVGPDRVVAITAPRIEDHWFALFAELAHENPLYQRWVQTRDGRAYRFSDVTTREALEATRLYQDFYVPLGVRHQIAFTLPDSSDQVLAIALSRGDHDYSDAERDFLNRARPFLIQAYRNALAHAELRRGPAGALADALGAQGLTPREVEVLRLVALAGSNRHIGNRLGVSERTVQKHLENAYRKLGVTGRSEAADRAWELAASWKAQARSNPRRQEG